MPMDPIQIPTLDDVRRAECVVRRYIAPTPLVRSYAFERELGLATTRRVWIKDYGWTPTGSFKVMGALNWVDRHQVHIGDRPVAAHSSGNFASGLAFACHHYGKRAVIVMPDNAPRVKFALTESFGATVHPYEIASDHETGVRDRLSKQLAEEQNAVMASPYDDHAVIAGNGVGGLEITASLQRENRSLSHFVCAVSGGGLMSGHALAIAAAYPEARIIAVEPQGADDFRQSLQTRQRVSIKMPNSICDGLLSYDVGHHNWPILRDRVSTAVAIPDADTIAAMHWIYHHHGLRTEPSGAITLAALLAGEINLDGDGDIVVVLSGRNIDEEQFRIYVSEPPLPTGTPN